MAFGLWTGGHLSGGPFSELMEHYTGLPDSAWLLVDSPYEFEPDVHALEVQANMIPEIVGDWFFRAKQFWSRCKHFGYTKADWRQMTVQQVTVLETFDACLAFKNKE